MCWMLVLMTTLAQGVTLESAYWAPDRATPYQWFEANKEIQGFFERDYRAAGYVHAIVRNSGNAAVEATGFWLNGQPLEKLREAREVIWWRLLPRPLAPGALGEVLVRLRNPLREACELQVTFDDGSQVYCEVGPEGNDLQLGTIGFTDAGDEVFLVVEAPGEDPGPLTKVLLDGRDVTGHCRILTDGFLERMCPVVLRPSEPLARGSYHVYTVETASGATASSCVRTLDAWVPLGSYGYGVLEEYARNGANGHANFSRSPQGMLDTHARMGMRTASMLGANEPAPWEVGHPGLYAYYLADEPDCGDWGFNEIPVGLRVGELAMEMEARAQRARTGDPVLPTFLTVDLTFKPANYWIYGPIADVCNPDCYPISLGADATMVREVVETARLGAAPRPLTFTFQGVLEGPRDPEAFAKLRFPRAAFPDEERLMMYYAIGAGARGLWNYIHCTENSETRWSRGSGEFPEVWNEIGRVYRELDHVAPLLALAHPTQLTTSETPKLWLRTLLCGDEAALVVWANDDYQQNRDSFICRPLEGVRLRLPRLPWLTTPAAYLVTEEGLRPLPVEGGEVVMPTMGVAGVVLLAGRPGLAEELNARYEARQQALGKLLLDEWRRNLNAEAQKRTEGRRIAGELGAYSVAAEPLGAYGMSLGGFWNPTGDTYNVLEFGVNDKSEGPEAGARWMVDLGPERAGTEQVVLVNCGSWGRAGVVTVTGPDGVELARQEVDAPWEGAVRRLSFVAQGAGVYTVRYAVPGPGPKGGRVAGRLFVAPKAALEAAGL